MLFVTPKFFEFEPIEIANVTENGNAAKQLARFIGLYEKQCRTEILGPCLNKLIDDNHTFEEGVWTLKGDAPIAIKRLVEGYDYDAPEDVDQVIDYVLYSGGCGCGCGESTCTKRMWKGFVQNDEYVVGKIKSNQPRSFLADYIYYHYMFVNRSVTSATGQQVVKSDNSTTVQNRTKRIDRFNEYVYGVVGGKSGQTSLYRFLHENPADYPEWKPKCDIRLKDKY